jgi:hypothetical protein
VTLGGVTVQPNVFAAVLERLPLAGWQVIEENGRLRVLLAGQHNGLNPETVRMDVAAALDRVGADDVAITAEVVDAIPRTALGKAPLVIHRAR